MESNNLNRACSGHLGGCCLRWWPVGYDQLDNLGIDSGLAWRLAGFKSTKRNTDNHQGGAKNRQLLTVEPVVFILDEVVDFFDKSRQFHDLV